MAPAYFVATLLIVVLMSPSVLAQGNSSGNANSNASSSNQSSGNQSSQSEQRSGNSSPPQINDHAEEEALRAVESGQAVPLSRIVGVLQRTNGAEVLDAKLVKAGNVLLYRLKLLFPNGRVTTEFYHAPTGQPIRPN